MTQLSPTTSNDKGEKKSQSPPRFALFGARRQITRVFRVHETSDGIGLRVRQCIGNPKVRCLPPFITCQHFKIDEFGRPPRPARGTQQVTYMLSGMVKIEYTPSSSLELGSGDLGSLMVGNGVIGSMRAQAPGHDKTTRNMRGNTTDSNATANGIQFCMDIPESYKRSDASNISLCHSDIVELRPERGVSVRLLTGSLFNKTAAQMLTTTPATVLDCVLEPGATFDLPVKSTWNAFLYVIQGIAYIQNTKTGKHDYVEFMRSPVSKATAEEAGPSEDEYVQLHAGAGENTEATHLLFCSAEPLAQPIFRQGPFVDVSTHWIQQAFNDYSESKNGFESGRLWHDHPLPQAVSATAASQDDVSGDEPPPAKPDISDLPFNPCEDAVCPASAANESDQEQRQEVKATYPNKFPPGRANPASHTTEFNDTDSIETQQEQKVPRKERKRRHSGSTSRDEKRRA